MVGPLGVFRRPASGRAGDEDVASDRDNAFWARPAFLEQSAESGQRKEWNRWIQVVLDVIRHVPIEQIDQPIGPQRPSRATQIFGVLLHLEMLRSGVRK